MTDSRPRTLLTLPIEALKESPNNPRKRFGDLADLSESIKARGVLEPLLVRPLVVDGGHGGYEIVAGHRRFRAAVLADIREVNVLSQDLSDTEALEVQLIENEQRQDVHPLEQAEGFARLIELDPTVYTIESIAKKVGVSASQVYQRMKLRALGPALKKAFLDDRFSTGHAILIARLGLKDQDRVFKDALFHNYDSERTEKGAAVSVRELAHWIERNVRLDLLSEAIDQEHPELAKKLAKMKAAGIEPLAVTTKYDNGPKAAKDAPLTHGSWEAVGKKKCASTKQAVVVLGDGQADVLDVCTNKQCKTHWPHQFKPAPRAKVSQVEAGKARKAAARQRAEADKAKKVRKFREGVIAATLERICVTKVVKLSRVVLLALARVAYGDLAFHDGFDVIAAVFGIKNAAGIDKLKDPQLVAFLAAGAALELSEGYLFRHEKAFGELAKACGADVAKIEAEIGKAEKAAADAKAAPAKKTKKAKAAA